MKTIEEKAKAYDEAIKKANVAYKDEDRHLKATLERIFPELKESEDDKVRKKLIHLVKKSHEQGGYALHKWEADEMLAWLEKQGEQKTITFNNAHIIDPALNNYCCKQYDALHKENGGVLSFARLQHLAMDIYGWCCKEYLQGEQKPADSYCQENCKGFQETGKCFADGECKAKRESDQKPEENKGNIGGNSPNWSDDDERMLNYVIGDILSADTLIGGKETASYKCDWLKSLKGRKGGKI